MSKTERVVWESHARFRVDVWTEEHVTPGVVRCRWAPASWHETVDAAVARAEMEAEQVGRVRVVEVVESE